MKKNITPTTLYLVELSSNATKEKFYKIGITSYDAKSRLSYGTKKVTDRDSGLSLSEGIRLRLKGQKYLRDNPYDEKVLLEKTYNYSIDAEIAEETFLNLVKEYQYKPIQSFSGYTECFIVSLEILEKLKKAMMGDADAKNTSAPSYALYQAVALSVKERNERTKHLAILAKCEERKNL